MKTRNKIELDVKATQCETL